MNSVATDRLAYRCAFNNLEFLAELKLSAQS